MLVAAGVAFYASNSAESRIEAATQRADQRVEEVLYRQTIDGVKGELTAEVSEFNVIFARFAYKLITEEEYDDDLRLQSMAKLSSQATLLNENSNLWVGENQRVLRSYISTLTDAHTNIRDAREFEDLNVLYNDISDLIELRPKLLAAIDA